VDLDLNSIFVAEAFAGLMRQSYSDARFSAITTPAFGFDGVWNVTPQSSLSLSVLRTIDETTGTTSPALVTTNVGSSAQYQFLDNLFGRVDYLHSFIDFPQTTSHDDVDNISVSAKYLVNSSLTLTPLIAFTNRASDRPGRTYDQLQALFTVTLAY